MSLSRILTFLAVLCAAALLLIGYQDAEGLLWLPLIALLAVLWLVSLWRSWALPIDLAAVAAFVLCANGLSLSLPPVLMVVAGLLVVFAWNSGHFWLRLHGLVLSDQTQILQRRFLLRSFLIALISAGLLYVALNLELDLGFAAALGLALLLIFAVSRIVSMLRDQAA